MIELTRGLSFVMYDFASGDAPTFHIPFPYLERDHVRLFVGTRQVSAEWVDATTLELTDLTWLPAAPFTVTIRRFTPFDRELIEFKDGANLPARDLNKAVRQSLYSFQEFHEFVTDGSALPGGPGGGAGNPDIETIIDGILNSAALKDLLVRIEDVDLTAETLLQRILRDHDIDNLTRQYGSRITSAETRVETIEVDGARIARQITDLLARVSTAESDIAANYQELNQAIATETHARVSSMESLHAQFTNDLGAANAALVQYVDQSYADAETAWTSADSVMLSNVNQSIGAVETLAKTKVTSTEASAIAQTRVEAFANGNFAALQQSFNTYATTNDNRWSATWSVKVQGQLPSGQPILAGVALSAGSNEGSNFVITTDRFALVHPQWAADGTLAGLKFPFVVGTVGGVSTVGIQGALVVDGTITADKIKANTLSAITANAGTINGGTFKTHTLDANGNVSNALEFRAEISNVGTWPIWVGSGVKNENNAVFWVDRLGNAGFRGNVSAPNITGAFQVIVPVSWGGTVTPGISTEVTRFDVPAPVRVGEEHATIISLAVNVQSVSSDNGVYGLYIQRLVGGTWENIVGAHLNHGSGHGINQALACITPRTSAATTYRVIATNVQNGERFRVQSVIGFAMGAR